MLNIHRPDPKKAGFRLQYMELLNWGTFDKKIYNIQPQGENSLLTGANGSGKTTCVDALLTLLVAEKRKRFYNQSSGVEKKGDRTENSYVYGAYGDVAIEGKGTTTQKLRKNNAYSIILANFESSNGKTLTLFQARWFVGNDLRREYGIAHVPLRIAEDFPQFDHERNWKKRLKNGYNQGAKKQVEFFDGPGKYSERLIGIFGMRSAKALGIFNKAVGIKVLGNLDEFIRNNMLENRDAETQFQKLEKSFRDLTDAQTNIQKIKTQINQLQPINQHALDLKKHKSDLVDLLEHEETSRFWFAEKGQTLTQEAIENTEQSKVEKETEKTENEQLKKELEREERRVSMAIENDEVGQQISALEAEIQRLERDKTYRERTLESYNELATKLKFPLNPNEKIFTKSNESAKENYEICQTRIDQTGNELFELKNRKIELENDINEKVETIKYLQQNDNNITGRIAEIRDEILQAVGARKRDIPFVGELIKVRETEKTWEASIEKVLHGFALRLVVPPQFYDKVNKYVNATNLRGRIVYQRFQSETSLREMQNFSDKSLCNKLEFNTKSPYAEWVEANIVSRYNYLCVETLKAFQTADKAITAQGLVKSKNRHEKDDRAAKNNPKNYVLGWDNQEKIRLLKREARQLQAAHDENEKALKEKQIEKQSLETQQRNLYDFFKLYTKFDEIHWEKYARDIQEKTQQKKALEADNETLRTLQKQLEKVLQKLEKAGRKHDKIVGKIKELEIKIDQLNEELERHKETLQTMPQDFESEERYAILMKRFKELKDIIQDNFAKQLRDFYKKIQENKKVLEADIQLATNDLNRMMYRFVHPEESITTRFRDWGADVSQLSENIEFVSEFQDMLQRLEYDDLIKYEDKFNDLLNEKITHQVGSFKQFFDQWEDQIREDIGALNESLIEIDFDSSPQATYIQLIARKRLSDNSKKFRKMLQDAIPNLALNTDLEHKKQHFERHIKPLIDQLSTDEKWRKEVTNVRNWFEYYAEKFYRENDEKMRSYKGMGSLSGGEKAQLTYTILGAAIAYQFGMSTRGLEGKSFRFIAIDESFSNQDEDKANFLMKLCEQLHLQLLVVTPSDKIHIVEPHISRVHFVTRPQARESILYDMPILEFKEERERFLTAQTVN